MRNPTRVELAYPFPLAFRPTSVSRIAALSMRIILGWSMVVTVGAVMLVNALLMLASPRAWFRLPSWIRAQGTLTEQKYSTGWRGVTVRLAGGVMLAVIGWVLYDLLTRQ
jgi:hypothetical protein